MATVLDKYQEKIQKNSKDQKDQKLAEAIPLWDILDLDSTKNWLFFVVLRLVQAIFLTRNLVHPDEYWQATMPSYNIVYGGVTLPWEWEDMYRLRNTLYPFYLSAPLKLLKMLELDTAEAVRMTPYLAHYPLVLMHDYLFWQIGKRVLGKNSARVGMLLLMTSSFQNQYLVRCFTNSIEQIFAVLSFYFFLDQERSFTFTTCMVTALITCSFMMRNTSPIGWIPLLAIKCLYHGSFLPFFFSAFVIAIPIIAINVYLDSIFFDPSLSTWTFTGYNFLNVNLVEGVSSYFGEEPLYWYITHGLSQILLFNLPLGLIAPFYHIKAQRKEPGKERPYMAYYVLFYITVFSLIKHKEARFLLPALPFIFLMIGQFITENMVPKYKASKVRKYVFFGIVVELVVWMFITLNHRLNWNIHSWLSDKNAHSYYDVESFEVPHYAYLHKQDHEQKTKIHIPRKAHSFARTKLGKDLIMAEGDDYTLCIEMLERIKFEQTRPEWINLTEAECDTLGTMVCFEACNFGLMKLDMYELQQTFKVGVQIDDRTNSINHGTSYLYKLKPEFTPF